MRVAFLFAVIVCVSAVQAQDRSEAVREVLEEAEITGLGAAIVEDGRISWAGAFGVRSAATNPAVDTSTVFEAASLTKPVVALVALQLVEEGLLDLDRPLAEYVEYPDLAHTGRGGEITARMVLSHTSGLPNWRPQGGQLDLRNAPGSTFGYSGEGFVYLQRAMEAVARRPLHTMVEDRVFVPLGMPSSSLVWREAFGPFVAVGHADDGTPLDKFTPGEANAAYSLHTTAADYARFLAAFLRGWSLSDAIWQDAVSRQADAGDGLAWGLGWGLQRTAQGESVWHWGDNRGYKAFVAGYPGQGRGFVFFSNSDNGMLALHRLVEVLDGTTHPSVPWLNYERFDNPSFQVGRTLRAAMADSTGPSLREAYRGAQDRFPRSAFTEDTLNDLGYRLLRAGRYEDAIEVFELNVQEYPDASNPYDSLGEAFMVSGQLEKALLNYRVSVDLDPGNTNGRAMIARLEAELARQR
ncbi:MAG: serine hydrolase [Rhodothermales bacterium]|nr:serine hydrolase [Rhodothermales bacterium]MBO6778580.1 serine hydrolase [Rhodothermales bacterium]